VAVQILSSLLQPFSWETQNYLQQPVLQYCGNDATGGIALGGTRTGGPLTALHLEEIESMESNDQPATGCHLPVTSLLEAESSRGLVCCVLAGSL